LSAKVRVEKKRVGEGGRERESEREGMGRDATDGGIKTEERGWDDRGTKIEENPWACEGLLCPRWAG